MFVKKDSSTCSVCEFCESIKNILFAEHLRQTSSGQRSKYTDKDSVHKKWWLHEYSDWSSRWHVFFEKAALKSCVKFTSTCLLWSSVSITFLLLVCNVIKKRTPFDVFSCVFCCKLFQNSLFSEHLWMTTAKLCNWKTYFSHILFSYQQLFKKRYYISLMDVAQNLIFVTSYYIYFKLLMILFSI